MATVKLSVAIMTHHSRSHLIEPLLMRLGKHHNITVITDTEDNSIWKTAKRAWLSFSPNATHHMVLQDDIKVCERLIDSLPDIIKHIPPLDSISLCSNHKASKYVEDNDLNWLRTNQVHHGQALIQPTSQIKDWIAWSDWNVRPDYRLDDGKLKLYLRINNRWIWNTIPSLVEHWNQGTVNKPKEKEVVNEHLSYKFIGEDAYPLQIDWSQGLRLPITKQEGLTPTDRWAIGREDEGLGRNDLNQHIVKDKKTMLIPYDEIMKTYRSTIWS